MRSTLFDIIIFTGLGLLIGFVWFKIYVQPNDAFLREVMDCMGDNMSERAYALCASQLK